MFGSKIVNVEFYLGRLSHNFQSSKLINFNENLDYARKIFKFIEYYINKRHGEIHPTKLEHLNKVKGHLLSLISLLASKENNNLKDVFSVLLEEFGFFSSFGAIFLIRHPDKYRDPGRNLTKLGVQQAKKVAERIKEEILMAPKPVRLYLFNSEFDRTELFGRIIRHINNAKKIGKENIQMSQMKDDRLVMGPVSKKCEAIYGEFLKKAKTKDEGTLKCYLEWLKRYDGLFADEMKKGGILDPEKIKADIDHFVSHVQNVVGDKKYYTLVIGLSHMWTLDVWLMHYAGMQEIINMSEFAKIEFNDLYYRKKWHSLEKPL